MQVEIKIDKDCKEAKFIIITDKMTDELDAIVKQLSSSNPKLITGFRDGGAKILEPDEIYRIYAESGRVFAECKDGNYLLRLRLYEIEEILSERFVRISNSDIINLKNVKEFNLSIAGTICVKLSNGTVTYVSRRFVGKIKRILGI